MAESPPEDIGGFHALVERAAAQLQLCMQVKQSDCFLYDFKYTARKSVRSIPIVDYIWEEGLKVMRTPAPVITVLPRIDKKYKSLGDAPACLISHPKPDSVISQAAHEDQGILLTPIITPPDKDGRRLDNIGKRFMTTSGATVPAANALAILARYDRQMWSDITQYLDLLPEDKCLEARKILLEERGQPLKL